MQTRSLWPQSLFKILFGILRFENVYRYDIESIYKEWRQIVPKTMHIKVSLIRIWYEHFTQANKYYRQLVLECETFTGSIDTKIV